MKIKLSELIKIIQEESQTTNEMLDLAPPPRAGEREAEMLEQVYDNIGKVAYALGWEHRDQELLADDLTETMKLLRTVMVRLGVFNQSKE